MKQYFCTWECTNKGHTYKVNELVLGVHPIYVAASAPHTGDDLCVLLWYKEVTEELDYEHLEAEGFLVSEYSEEANNEYSNDRQD